MWAFVVGLVSAFGLLMVHGVIPAFAQRIVGAAVISANTCTTANAIPRLTTAATSAAVTGCTPLTSDGTNVTSSGAFLGPGTPSVAGDIRLRNTGGVTDVGCVNWMNNAGTGNVGIGYNNSDVLGTSPCGTVNPTRIQWFTVGGFGIDLQSNQVAVSRNLTFDSDGLYNIGASGTTRPIDLWLSGPSITAASGTGVTVNSSGSVRGLEYKVTVSYTNCVANATTCDLTIATLPAKTYLKRVVADLTTTYACAAVCTSSSLSGLLGTSAGGNQLLLSWDLDAATGQFGDANGELGATLASAAVDINGAANVGVLTSWTGTTTITYRITSGAGNLGNGTTTNLSQGSITFYVSTEVLP